MGFFRQEYWSGFPFPSPWDFPDPGVEPRSPALQADTLTSEPQGNPNKYCKLKKKKSPYSLYPGSTELCVISGEALKSQSFIKNRLMVVKGSRGWGRMEEEVGVSRCKLLHTGWIDKKVLL